MKLGRAKYMCMERISEVGATVFKYVYLLVSFLCDRLAGRLGMLESEGGRKEIRNILPGLLWRFPS